MADQHDEYAVQTSGGTGEMVMVRKDATGELVKTPFAFTDYDVVDEEIVDFEITGFQPRFEMNRPARYMVIDTKTGFMPDPVVSKTRLEFTVISGPQAGKRWLGLYTWTVGEKSGLGKLIRQATRQPIPQGWRMPDVIGVTGRGYVRHSTDANTGDVKLDKFGNPYPDISTETVKPLSKPRMTDAEVPSILRPTPKAQPKGIDFNKMTNEPMTYDDFWAWARPYGFNKLGDLRAATGMNYDALDELTAQDLYELMSEHVGEKASA